MLLLGLLQKKENLFLGLLQKIEILLLGLLQKFQDTYDHFGVEIVFNSICALQQQIKYL